MRDEPARLSRRDVGTTIGIVVALAVSLVVAARAASPSPSDGGSVERWSVLDRARYIGRIEWTCKAGRSRLRYVATGPTEEVWVRLGRQLYAKASIQPGEGLEMPLGGRVQRWRVVRISESLPPAVVFRAKPTLGRCSKPLVTLQRVESVQPEPSQR